MRDRSRATTVAVGEPIGRVLTEMIRKKNGAAIIEDAQHRLLGIFTHGDFIRYYTENPRIGEEKVEDYMTTNPITIRDVAFAVEALGLFRDHNIDELVVVDAANQVQGIIDIQDLSRHRLI